MTDQSYRHRSVYREKSTDNINNTHTSDREYTKLTHTAHELLFANINLKTT